MAWPSWTHVGPGSSASARSSRVGVAGWDDVCAVGAAKYRVVSETRADVLGAVALTARVSGSRLSSTGAAAAIGRTTRHAKAARAIARVEGPR